MKKTVATYFLYRTDGKYRGFNHSTRDESTINSYVVTMLSDHEYVLESHWIFVVYSRQLSTHSSANFTVRFYICIPPCFATAYHSAYTVLAPNTVEVRTMVSYRYTFSASG